MKNKIFRWIIYRTFGPWLLYPAWNLLWTVWAYVTDWKHTRVNAVLLWEGNVCLVQHTGHHDWSIPGGTYIAGWGAARSNEQLLLHLQNELYAELGVCLEKVDSVRHFDIDFVPSTKFFIGYRWLPAFVFALKEKPTPVLNHEVTEVNWRPVEKLQASLLDKYTRRVLFSLEIQGYLWGLT